MEHKELFTIKTLEIAPSIFLSVQFEKETRWDENDSCYLRLEVDLGDDLRYHESDKIRYVYNNSTSIDALIKGLTDLVERVSRTIEAIDNGQNLLEDFYIKYPGISNSSVEVRRDIKRNLASFNEFKITPIVMEIYSSLLIHYKGDDTLQYRKYKQGLQSIQDGINYNRRNNNVGFMH